MPKERNPLKIAFVGTSCTGKTTLIDHFSEKYNGNPHIAFVEEGARAYFRAHPVPERFTVDVQRNIRAVTLRHERQAHESGAKVILCDTSVVDQVVYTKALARDEKGAATLFSEIKNWMPTYGKFYVLNPKDVIFENDDVRKESAMDRQRVHDTFLELLEEKRIAYEMLSGTVEERFKKVDGWIRQEQIFPKA